MNFGWKFCRSIAWKRRAYENGSSPAMIESTPSDLSFTTMSV